MKRARRILLIGLVWLTAAGSLFAGFSHAACLCTAGADSPGHKQAATPSRCCCGPGCTSGETSCPYCGKHSEESRPREQQSATEKEGPSAPALRAALCRHGIVPSNIVGAAASRADAKATQTMLLAEPLPPSERSAAGFTPNRRDSREIHLLPPPTDLVTVLQHFLI